MSSAESGYGQISCRELTFANDLISKGTGASNELRLNVTDQTADASLNFPDLGGTDRTILHDGSTISGTQLDVTGSSSMNPLADADELFGYDASATANAKITAAQVKTYVLLTGNQHEIQVCDSGGDFASVAMSGDCTIADTGSVTLTDKPATAGTAEASKFVQLDGSKDISALNDVSAANLTASADVQCANLLVGTSKWRIRHNAIGDDLEMQWWSGVAWVTKHTFSNA